MTIEHEELWSKCPASTQETARSVMIGASVAWWLIYIDPQHDGYNGNGKGGYVLTMAGPLPHSPIVATNLPDQFPGWNSRF